MVGFVANRRGGRLPSVVLVGMMVVLVLLSYNYWSVSRMHGRALDELAEVHAQVKRTDAARTRLEKRNSELMLQADTHRRQIDQKDGDYNVLEGKLQARDALMKKCLDEKMKLQSEFSQKTTDINQLKEQLKEMRDEIIRQEEQVRELRKNNTNLEKKMEYESLQCGQQIAQLKDEYEESRKLFAEKAAKLKKDTVDTQNAGPAVAQADRGTVTAGEHHPVAPQHHNNPDIKDDLGKPGSDAGMPGIEDSEVGKVDEVQFALKKPAITMQHVEPAEPAVDIKPAREGAGPNAGADAAIAAPGAGAGAGEGPGFDAPRGLPLDHPDLPQNGGKVLPPIQEQVPQPIVDRPVVMNEGNKVDVQADEFGEQRRQMRDSENPGAALPPPPNPVQVLPKPIEPRRDAAPAAPLRHRQNDEDREVPGDHRGEYGKRHQAIDIL
ncbi:protein GOLM2 isoform X2 [Silurus meridionalis]|uniref:protein GOLM2 isoform X2 n=1 Tax=Silurus meridionalis TaxID=175797 RepID=UPI001EEA0C2B|nr:protein GOLM2 isoform X2 [Silurus meridionalis]